MSGSRASVIQSIFIAPFSWNCSACFGCQWRQIVASVSTDYTFLLRSGGLLVKGKHVNRLTKVALTASFPSYKSSIGRTVLTEFKKQYNCGRKSSFWTSVNIQNIWLNRLVACVHIFLAGCNLLIYTRWHLCLSCWISLDWWKVTLSLMFLLKDQQHIRLHWRPNLIMNPFLWTAILCSNRYLPVQTLQCLFISELLFCQLHRLHWPSVWFAQSKASV